ncbi:class I SAM-dependent methyltransferase [Flavobacterium sp.]|uniref:class I SAM-dependent methyltransferase n=1 Tax=Flavobacterium sp. TaxID=239 RepID=UPI003D6B6C58
MNEEIKQYYNDLASSYDSNRFENSYGKYIDNQERVFLKDFLSKITAGKILDLGCGTGRFLDFANFGVDISPNMIEIAKSKFPEKEIKEGSVSAIPFQDYFFDAIFSLHVIMHLNKEITEAFLEESHKKLNANGTLIFDFPSKKRRRTTQYNAGNWHAANQFSIEEILQMTKTNWILKKYHGILFIPIHRLPSSIRSFFIKIDNFLCRSFLKEYASYVIIELEKK